MHSFLNLVEMWGEFKEQYYSVQWTKALNIGLRKNKKMEGEAWMDGKGLQNLEVDTTKCTFSHQKRTIRSS